MKRHNEQLAPTSNVTHRVAVRMVVLVVIFAIGDWGAAARGATVHVEPVIGGTRRHLVLGCGT